MRTYKVFLNGVDMSFCPSTLLSWKEAIHEYQIYKSVSREIENTLSALPKDGLNGYRLNADTKAKIIFSSYEIDEGRDCLLYTSPSPRDRQKSRMPSSA